MTFDKQAPAANTPYSRLPTGKVDVAKVIELAGLELIEDVWQAAAGIWPENDSIDDFLAAREEWQGAGRSIDRLA